MVVTESVQRDPRFPTRRYSCLSDGDGPVLSLNWEIRQASGYCCFTSHFLFKVPEGNMYMYIVMSLHPFSHLLKKQRGPVSCFLCAGQPTIPGSGDRIQSMMLFYASWEAHIPSCKFLLAPTETGPGARPGPCCPIPQVWVGTVPVLHGPPVQYPWPQDPGLQGKHKVSACYVSWESRLLPQADSSALPVSERGY